MGQGIVAGPIHKGEAAATVHSRNICNKTGKTQVQWYLNLCPCMICCASERANTPSIWADFWRQKVQIFSMTSSLSVVSMVKVTCRGRDKLGSGFWEEDNWRYDASFMFSKGSCCPWSAGGTSHYHPCLPELIIGGVCYSRGEIYCKKFLYWTQLSFIENVQQVKTKTVLTIQQKKQHFFLPPKSKLSFLPHLDFLTCSPIGIM